MTYSRAKAWFERDGPQKEGPPSTNFQSLWTASCLTRSRVCLLLSLTEAMYSGQLTPAPCVPSPTLGFLRKHTIITRAEQAHARLSESRRVGSRRETDVLHDNGNRIWSCGLSAVASNMYLLLVLFTAPPRLESSKQAPTVGFGRAAGQVSLPSPVHPAVCSAFAFTHSKEKPQDL
jgi:hypothetical protein